MSKLFPLIDENHGNAPSAAGLSGRAILLRQPEERAAEPN
jgi:hypothetical protein